MKFTIEIQPNLLLAQPDAPQVAGIMRRIADRIHEGSWPLMDDGFKYQLTNRNGDYCGNIVIDAADAV